MMRKLKLMRHIAAVSLLSLLGGTAVQKAHAELTAIGAGVSVPTPMGDDYQTYERLAGFIVEAWTAAPEFMGVDYRTHLTFGYQPYDIVNLSDVTLRQIYAFYGFETQFAGSKLVIPFISADAGAFWSWLHYSRTSNNALDAGGSFALQFRSGFTIPLFDQLAINVSVPFIFVFTNNFSTWNINSSLRWSL